MIILKALRLINWYGFGCVTAPIGKFTLIAGKNGNGKSVLLDAIKYALYGDTVFNKSSENTGSRTLSSYTRGLLDATAGTCMRSADKFPNVYSHIVLEFADEDSGKSFVLGTVIETAADNGVKTHRYIIENKKLAQLQHTKTEQGLQLPLSARELQELLSLRLFDATDGVLRFLQRTGLRRMDERHKNAFLRKLRSIMTYDPSAKIDKFIREKVLEEKKVDLSKLVEAKTNIDRLNQTFAHIQEEIVELDAILVLFEQVRTIKQNLLADDIKFVYKQVLELRKKLVELEQQLIVATKQLEDDKTAAENLELQQNELQQRLQEATFNLQEMDCAKAITMVKEQLAQLQQEKRRLQQECAVLAAFQKKVAELVAWLAAEQQQVANAEILQALELGDSSAAAKATAVEALSRYLGSYRDELLAALIRLQDAQQANLQEQETQKQIIEACRKRTAAYNDIPDYVLLKNAINREFSKKGLPAEAKFACEYVIGLKDEQWRDAIEAYLGRRRYTILVPPDYYEVADEVFNAVKNKRAHLFNTELLMQKNVAATKDSVMNFLEVKNSVAQQYFSYLLGKLHAVPLQEVRKYENALSVEGRVAVAMDGFFLDFSRLRSYYLGQEAIELNKKRAEQRLAQLVQTGQELQEQKALLTSKKAYLEQQQGYFGGYNYDAPAQYTQLLQNLKQREEELEQLLEAQKQNSEFMELSQLCDRLEQELHSVKELLQQNITSQLKMGNIIAINQENLAKTKPELQRQEGKLQAYAEQQYAVYIKAVADYDKYIANDYSGQGGIYKDRPRMERNLEENKRNLAVSQANYNSKRAEENRLPLVEDDQGAYVSRRERIWVDDLQDITKDLAEQTKRYNEIFKNEFVLTVLKSCEQARENLHDLNRELGHLDFKAKYEFSVKYVKDGSPYEKLLEYARYLQEQLELGTGEGQLSLLDSKYTSEQGVKLEQEISKIVDRILGSNDKTQLENYADYRNYMTYELLLTSETLTKSRLSRQAGYNSGAEVQIPYMLILLTALLLVYNESGNSTRLVFIDEPFAKMDPVNIKIMLKFMKAQRLQLIFCAPDKTEVIGQACEVVLPVLRTRADLMELGIIEFHKEVAL